VFDAAGNITLLPKCFLVSWLILLLITLLLFRKQNKFWLLTLTFSAFALASAFALFTPYLYTWDEQFHALVAKNNMANPFHPKLFQYHPEGITIPNDQWVLSETWLHKQPFFTWLMALSLKLCGTSVFAVRLPSVVLFSIMIPVVYRIGKLLFSKKTGLIAALFVMHSAYLLGLVSGRIGTDHNDAVFIALILLSFWAFFEWQHSNAKKWIYLIGLFVGLAVLTKWLVGLLVFFGWGIFVLREIYLQKKLQPVKPILLSFSIAFLIFLPWQIYTFIKFPELAKQEMTYNSQHLTQVIEEHSGGPFFHFDNISNLYFEQTIFYILLALSLLGFVLFKPEWEKMILIFLPITIVYAFFSFAQTKMPSFTAVVIPLVLLMFAFTIDAYTALIKNKWMKIILLLLVVVTTINLLLKPGQTLDAFGFKEGTALYNNKVSNTAMLELIRKQPVNDRKKIVFGCDWNKFAYIFWMFYTDDIAYPFYPDLNTVDDLIEQGYEIELIDWNNSIPEKLRKDPRLKVL
jgi:4-amino-4-deoxy-L-arabinose transferase-like glycosyltransferase